MSRARRWAPLGLAALLAWHAPAAAENLCTVDRVERTGWGADVYFSAMRLLTIYRPGVERRVVVADPKARDAVGFDRLGPFRGVSLAVDDRVVMPFGDRRHCEIKVFAKDGRTWIEVTLWEPRVGGHAGTMGEGQMQVLVAE